MTMETQTTLSFWEGFLGGEDFHWIYKTAGISVDLEKTEWEALLASRTAWMHTKSIWVSMPVCSRQRRGL